MALFWAGNSDERDVSRKPTCASGRGLITPTKHAQVKCPTKQMGPIRSGAYSVQRCSNRSARLQRTIPTSERSPILVHQSARVP